MGVADFVALGAIGFASGFGFTLDQANIGREFLNGLKALDIADLVKDNDRQNTAHTGNGAQHTERGGAMLLGLLLQVPFQLTQFAVIARDNRKIEINIALNLGVGSFVYLRRIFESLIEKAHETAVGDSSFDEASYQRGRMADRITMLRGHVPDFLADHPKLYSILSKGIHELSEEECLKHFPVVKVGIELILDDKLEEIRRQKKLEEASRAINDAGS
jgi:hypothetical protein